MDTTPKNERILSGYNNVRPTLTYGLLVTLPLLLVYQIGLYFVNTQNGYAMINRSDTGVFLLLGMMIMLYLERKRLGFIQVRVSFFFLTLPECIFFALALGFVSLWLHFPSKPESFLQSLVYGAGAGFYEELLYRVIFLGGLLALSRAFKIPEMPARIVAVVITSMMFSWSHYTGPYGEPLTVVSFLYRSYAGVFLSYIYMYRGFATAAWTHALFDIFHHI